ncbi:glycosyltransferase [Bellilinea caldifistulae]|uniref:glycosyltransferase family 2 protein n=1 Tax=Bellilinea caldifistulae TaxID=360411 RepID=UPI00078325C2|nr:glycosyltransferase family 2 protein [Bellilinea caldifistulae]GAP09529.1 glycosyltransferase [Bellilinea caldifistulae]
MSAPLVSIITPSFNQAAFLEQTIRSVLEQTYPQIEYMVVDGGSTDGSREIIEKYADRLAWWVSEKDAGQADGINKGLRRAQGEIVAWLNSDDYYLPAAVGQAVEVFRHHPQAGLVFSDVESVDGEGNRFNIMRFGEWGLTDLMAFRIISQPGVFMRRSVLEQAGYLDPNYHYLLDHHLWLRMAVIAPLHYARGARWAAARFHPAAKNVAQAAGFGNEALRLAAWMESDPRFKEHLPSVQRRMWAGAYRLDAFYRLDAGDRRAALAAYAQAFRYHPPTVLRDWRRLLYALLSPLGLEGLRQAYLRRRSRRFQQRGH